jgi:uncharacterized protein YjiS (DUF1127 family)
MTCRNHAIVGRPLAYAAQPATLRGGSRPVFELCRAVLLTWSSRLRERNALSDLDDRLLDDIGLAREAAERAWRKPFWQAGGNR